MKKTVLLICALLISGLLLSQNKPTNSKIEWCKPQKINTGGMFMGFDMLGYDNENIYCCAKQGLATANYYQPSEFVRYNIKNQKLDAVDFTLKSDGNRRDFEFVYMVKDKIYLFSSFQNKKHKKHYLFAQTADIKTLTLNPDLKKIAELDYIGESKKRPAIFDYKLSPDSSKLLIHYVLVDKENIILRSGFTVFDEDCNSIWESDNISSGTGGFFTFQQYLVSNSGDVFIGGLAYKDKKEYKKEEEEAKYHVITYLKEEKGAFPISVSLPENKYSVSTKLALNNKSELYCVGFFSQIGMSNAIGVFSSKIDVFKKRSENVHIKNFDLNFLTKGMDENDINAIKKKMAKGDDYEDYSYNIKDIHFMENGSFVVVTEKKRVNIVAYTDRSGTTYSHNHYYGDIMTMNIKENGEFYWMQKIPRDIKLVNDALRLGSFGVVYGKDNSTKIFYNAMNGGMFAGPKKTNLVLINYDANGKESWEELHDASVTKIGARPAELIDNKSGSIFMFGQKKITPAVFKITLN